MDCYLPAQTVGFFRGEPRIVVPSLVEEFLGPVRQPTPHERRNRINDFSQWGFPLLDLLKHVFHCFSAHRPRDENANRLSILLRRRPCRRGCRPSTQTLTHFLEKARTVCFEHV